MNFENVSNRAMMCWTTSNVAVTHELHWLLCVVGVVVKNSEWDLLSAVTSSKVVLVNPECCAMVV